MELNKSKLEKLTSEEIKSLSQQEKGILVKYYEWKYKNYRRYTINVENKCGFSIRPSYYGCNDFEGYLFVRDEDFENTELGVPVLENKNDIFEELYYILQLIYDGYINFSKLKVTNEDEDVVDIAEECDLNCEKASEVLSTIDIDEDLDINKFKSDFEKGKFEFLKNYISNMELDDEHSDQEMYFDHQIADILVDTYGIDIRLGTVNNMYDKPKAEEAEKILEKLNEN